MLNLRKLICVILSIILLPFAQVHAEQLVLPLPGTMVQLSPASNPPILKGIKVYKDNPFKFDFIIDNTVDAPFMASNQDESKKLVKYFLAALTTPEKDMWVNLSPYEKDRIVPDSFGQTEMGRDLLAQDYILKQLTASLIYPENQLGKEFWKRVYELSKDRNIPINTFNKVWIVPNKAVVYENSKNGTAYVVESSLKVMLEEDYLATNKNVGADLRVRPNKINKTAQDAIRQIVLPQLTKEINEGANFAQLRQVYNALILATWYKKKIKNSILSKVYANQNRIAGVNIENPEEKQKIYARYLEAFKKGAYNYIKEEPDPITNQLTPRKYFSGGMKMDMAIMEVVNTAQVKPLDQAMVVKVRLETVSLLTQSVLGLSADEKDFLEEIKALNLKENSNITSIGGTPEQSYLKGLQQVREELLFAALNHHVTLFQYAWTSWNVLLNKYPWNMVRKIDYRQKKFTSESNIPPGSQSVVILKSVLSSWGIDFNRKVKILKNACAILNDEGYLEIGWYNWKEKENDSKTGEQMERERTREVMKVLEDEGYVFTEVKAGFNPRHQWRFYKVRKPSVDNAMVNQDGTTVEKSHQIAVGLQDQWRERLEKQNGYRLNDRILQALVEPLAPIVERYLNRHSTEFDNEHQEEALRALVRLGVNRLLAKSMLDWAEDVFQGVITHPFPLDQWSVVANERKAYEASMKYEYIYKINFPERYRQLNEEQQEALRKDLADYLMGLRDRTFSNYDEQKKLDATWLAVKYQLSDTAFKEFVTKDMLPKILEPEQYKFLREQGFNPLQIKDIIKDADLLWRRWQLFYASSMQESSRQQKSLIQQEIYKLGLLLSHDDAAMLTRRDFIKAVSASLPLTSNTSLAQNKGDMQQFLESKADEIDLVWMYLFNSKIISKTLSKIDIRFERGLQSPLVFPKDKTLILSFDVYSNLPRHEFFTRLALDVAFFSTMINHETALNPTENYAFAQGVKVKVLESLRGTRREGRIMETLEDEIIKGKALFALVAESNNKGYRVESIQVYKPLNRTVIDLYNPEFAKRKKVYVSQEGKVVVMFQTTDSAQIGQTETNYGGIDFNAEQLNLESQNSTDTFEFKLDNALLKQFQDAPGFTPVIIGMQPIPVGADGLKMLRNFLGAEL